MFQRIQSQAEAIGDAVIEGFEIADARSDAIAQMQAIAFLTGLFKFVRFYEEVLGIRLALGPAFHTWGSMKLATFARQAIHDADAAPQPLPTSQRITVAVWTVLRMVAVGTFAIHLSSESGQWPTVEGSLPYALASMAVGLLWPLVLAISAMTEASVWRSTWTALLWFLRHPLQALILTRFGGYLIAAYAFKHRGLFAAFKLVWAWPVLIPLIWKHTRAHGVHPTLRPVRLMPEHLPDPALEPVVPEHAER